MIRKIPSFRWLVAGALFLAAVLNCIDRKVLSLMAPTIQKDLGISDDEYANVLHYFMIGCGSTLGGMFMNKIVAAFVGGEPMRLPRDSHTLQNPYHHETRH